MKIYKMNKKLFAALFCILFAAIASAYFCIYLMVNHTIEQLEDTSYDYLVSTTDIIEDKINGTLKRDFQKTKNLSETIVLNNGTLEYALREFNKNNEFYSSTFLNTKGIGINHLNQPVTIKELKVKDTAISKGKTSISSSYLSDGGEILILIQVPVYRKQKLEGAVYCEIMVRHYYTNDLFAFQEGKGRTFIVDNKKGSWMLRSPASDMLKINSDGLYETLQDTGNDQSTLQALKQCVNQRDTGVFKLKSAKEAILLCTTPLEDMEEWQIITVMPDDLFKTQIDNIVQNGWIMFTVTTIGFVLVLIILGLSLRRRNDKKIDTLVKTYETQLQEEGTLMQEILQEAYDFAILVDLNTVMCKVIPYKTQESIFMDLPEAYEKAFQQYCHMIYLDDVHKVQETLSLSALQTEKDAKQTMRLQYRLMVNQETRWYECCCIYNKAAAKNTVYLMHKDITKQMQEQMEILKHKYQ